MSVTQISDVNIDRRERLAKRIEGRCCRRCNDTVVIPTRIVAIYRAERGARK